MIAIMAVVVLVFVRFGFTSGVQLNDGFVLIGFLAAWIGCVQLLFDMANGLRTRPLGGPPDVRAVGSVAPAGQAAASSPRVPTAVSMPLTPAMREALDRARRKHRNAGLVFLGALEATPLITLLLG